MGETAVRAAAAAGYVNAGTCEFLLDRDGAFYFLEMNTRIQVEHPGDGARDGDRSRAVADPGRGRASASRSRGGVAAADGMGDRVPDHERGPGERIPAVDRSHHAICESRPARVCAGTAASKPGTDVGLYYDPLLAKLIVWAPTRDAAIARMQRALRELVIDGVVTSRELHLRILDDPEFAAGAFDIHWLERRLREPHGAPRSRRTKSAHGDQRGLARPLGWRPMRSAEIVARVRGRPLPGSIDRGRCAGELRRARCDAVDHGGAA